MTREKQIEYFKGCLMATGREGVEDLLTSSKNLVFMMPLHLVETIAVKMVDC